jgi:hypothetical protein
MAGVLADGAERFDRAAQSVPALVGPPRRSVVPDRRDPVPPEGVRYRPTAPSVALLPRALAGGGLR